MNKSLLAILLIAISGCGNNEDTKDIVNACAEISSTTQGFSGPSQRMEILKSYGFTPTEARNVETLFQQRFRIDNLNYKGYCGEKMQSLLTCPLVLAGVSENLKAYEEFVMEEMKNCS